MAHASPMTAIDTAMVLAAGFGTRMRPFTDSAPKPLVLLAGRTLLDRVLDRLSEAGIARAVVNVHHFAEQIEGHLATRKVPEVLISDERDQLLDTGGAVMRALPLLGRGPLLVHNADSVWVEPGQSNLRALIAGWRPDAMSALLMLAPRDECIGFEGKGDFFLDAEGRLHRRGDAARAPFVFAGVSILKPRLFDGITDCVFSLNRIFDRASTRGELFGRVITGSWMHVGTPAALAAAEFHLLERERGAA